MHTREAGPRGAEDFTVFRFRHRFWRQSHIRRFSFEPDLNLTYNLKGEVESRRLDLQVWRMDLQAGDIFEVDLLPLFEQLPRDFEIFDEVVLPAGADYNQVELREGRFTTRVWQGDVNTQFGPFVSLVNSLQFDTVTRQLGWQSRFRWIMKPGNDVFVVYNHNWSDRLAFHTLDRRGSIKIVKTIRF